jgi:major capsid protein gp7
MANITLLDLAARTGSDAVIGLVESSISFAPELSFYEALPKNGTSYKVTRRTALPQAQFVQHGAGATTSKSTYVQETKDMFPMLTNLEIPELTAEGSDDSLGDLLADEAGGAVQQALFHLCQQFYYGTANDAYGFSGYVQLINGDPTYEIDAGGAPGASTSAYLVAGHKKGVSLAVGKNGNMNLSPWVLQQVVTGGNSTSGFQKQPAYTSAFKGWFGLTVANKYSVYRVKHIDATHPLTDKLAAQLVSLIPSQYRIGLHWFMNEVGQFSLQSARSSVGFQPAGATGNPGFAPAPTEVAGYPITVTSTILNTEA